MLHCAGFVVERKQKCYPDECIHFHFRFSYFSFVSILTICLSSFLIESILDTVYSQTCLFLGLSILVVPTMVSILNFV